MRKELELIRSRTSNPINVNFFVHTPPRENPEREANWRRLLGPFYQEYGIDPATIPTGAGRSPFDDAYADALEPFKPEFVSFHFGLPDSKLVERVKGWGSKIISSATTVAEAQWLEANGVDAVIAQGLEAGGHRGMFLTSDLTTQVGTLSLVPQVVRAVKIPVIAAGGIADAAGVRAALALGASAVQLGTAFMLCDEATIHPLHRAALKSEGARHTTLTNVFTGRPSRCIMNRMTREMGPINPAAPEFPLATSAVAPLRAKAEAKGLGDFSPLWSGQNATGCREGPAAKVVESLLA
jgi:nitronate monooxygenase